MRYRVYSPSVMLATAVVAFSLAGCSGDDGPAGPVTPFDPDATAQAAAELESRLDVDSDVMMSLQLVSPALEAEGGALVQLLPGGVVRPARPFNAQMMVDPSFAMEPIFPSNFLGTTFEWDDGLGRYAMTARTGAPANGVRFILYAVDPFSGEPVMPLNEIGWLDLTDEGSASATQLRVFANTGGVDRLSYTVSASYALLGDNVEATATGAGFISDGSRTLVFNLVQTVAFNTVDETMRVDMLFDLRMDDENVRVVVDVGSDVDLSAPDVSLDVMLTVTDGGNVTVLDVTVDQTETLTGSVVHNGQTIALMDGSTSAPVFTDANGDPLSTAEVAALTQAFDIVDDVFDFVEAIFAPFGSTEVSL
ncbi:MAG: hypothetical protein JJE01_14025 [Gemmatimonadetes bacterium]|nr:hypothetical protein [Gemmatimonadota bacterium]